MNQLLESHMRFRMDWLWPALKTEVEVRMGAGVWSLDFGIYCRGAVETV